MRQIKFKMMMIFAVISLNLFAQDLTQKENDRAIYNDSQMPINSTINADTSGSHNIVEKRIAQISFLPTIGTNLKSSRMVSNCFSLNVLAGYNGGVNGLEIGSLVNLIDNNVKGVQIAGLSNIVAGKTTGLQIAGLSNTNKGSVTGLQIAGLSNIVAGKTKGLQVAGLSNIVAGKTTGLQIAGLQNVNKEKVVGVQIAGISNYLLDTLKGVQISGILNKTKQNNGLQIGLINVSDSSQGIAIGLVNYVKNGYKSIEVSANEIFYTNIKYKMGTKQFYTIYSLGVRPNNLEFYGAGLGFGSNINVYKKISLSIEATSTYVHEIKNQNSDSDSDLNLNNRLDLSLDYKLQKNLYLFIGPSLNVHVSELKDKNSNEFSSNITSSPFYSESNNNTLVQMWIGGSFGLRYSF